MCSLINSLFVKQVILLLLLHELSRVLSVVNTILALNGNKLHSLYRSPIIVRVIKFRRLRWGVLSFMNTIVALNGKKLHSLYRSPIIVRVIKSRRLRWAGNVAKMEKSRRLSKF